MLDITKTTEGNTVTLQLSGRIDTDTAALLRREDGALAPCRQPTLDEIMVHLEREEAEL